MEFAISGQPAGSLPGVLSFRCDCRFSVRYKKRRCISSSGAFELARVFHQFVHRNTGAEHSLWADIITSFHSWAQGSRKRKHLGRCDGVGGVARSWAGPGWRWLCPEHLLDGLSSQPRPPRYPGARSPAGEGHPCSEEGLGRIQTQGQCDSALPGCSLWHKTFLAKLYLPSVKWSQE